MNRTFEPFSETDIEQRQAVTDLLARCFPTHHPDLLQVEMARATDPRIGVGMTCRIGDTIAGVVLYRQPRDGVVFIVYLGVHPDMRRRGIGWQLVDIATQRAGVDRVELYVDVDNHGARQLYTVAGLAPSGQDAPSGQLHLAGRWRRRSAAIVSTEAA